MTEMHEQTPGAGDEFDAVFQDLFVQAYRVARRIVGEPSAAEDVAAEALSRAYAHWPKVRRLPYRDAWVMRVTTNLALDVARRRPPHVGWERAEAHDDATATRLALVEALSLLSTRQRECCDISET
jgi:DNA-directed RNA polymerase specialized sigma24 family protein